MGIKLEIVLLLLIVGTIIMTTTTKLMNNKDTNITISKELEFKHTTFIEVDQKQMNANLFATYGIQDQGILKLENLRYHNHNIDNLTADKGRYNNNILYLDGNVTLIEKEGYIYTTNHANYHQKNEILMITAPFVAHMGENVIHGNRLKYLVAKKELNATTIDATVYTAEK